MGGGGGGRIQQKGCGDNLASRTVVNQMPTLQIDIRFSSMKTGFVSGPHREGGGGPFQ